MTGSLIETPTLGDRTIADDRTRHHAPRARMDGWWPAAARIALLFSQPPNARRAAEDCLDETAVLMDRSPDPPVAGAIGGSGLHPLPASSRSHQRRSSAAAPGPARTKRTQETRSIRSRSLAFQPALGILTHKVVTSISTANRHATTRVATPSK